jgi:hypothetical protein
MANIAAVRMFRDRSYHVFKTRGSSNNAFENPGLKFCGDHGG